VEAIIAHDIPDPGQPLPPLEAIPTNPHPAQAKVLRAAASRRPFFYALIGSVVLSAVAACSGGSPSVPATSVAPNAAAATAAPATSRSVSRGVANIANALPGTSPTPIPANLVGCAIPGIGTIGTGIGGPAGSCNVTQGPQKPSSAPVGGLTPAQLHTLYGLPAIVPAAQNQRPTGPVVAVVDAFNAANAQNDLTAYRKQFGLPICEGSCFTVVNVPPLPGSLPAFPPAPNSITGTTWADETALDLAMVSAACPNCKIVLVQAAGNDLDSLANADNVAASFKPVAISNSWGVLEAGNLSGIDAGAQAAFNHPGIAITADAGDLGAVQFPATSPYVTSVGGTSLTLDAASPRGYDESLWTSSPTGCSTMFAAPTWQTGAACGGARAGTDISILGDVTTGYAVYSTIQGGWIVLGGTSAGAPFIAGLYGAANDYPATATGASTLYAARGSFNTVLNAKNTTLGSPSGLTGF
jgi:subtilase family serine protease